MTKPFLYWLFAPVQLLPMLRQLAKSLGDGGDAELKNFGVSICRASDPLTIIASGGCSGPVGKATVDYLEALLESDARLANVTWARCANEAAPARVLRCSHAPTQARIDAGEMVRWDMEFALAQHGMKLYTPPEQPTAKQNVTTDLAVPESASVASANTNTLKGNHATTKKPGSVSRTARRRI